MKKEHEKKHRAKGGRASEEGSRNEQDYTPKDVAEMKESKDTTDSFKGGGKVKKKVSHAEGKKAHKRMDKRARGGATGHSPMTHASKVSMRPGAEMDSGVDREDD